MATAGRGVAALLLLTMVSKLLAANRPHIVFIVADDLGKKQVYISQRGVQEALGNICDNNYVRR